MWQVEGKIVGIFRFDLKTEDLLQVNILCQNKEHFWIRKSG